MTLADALKGFFPPALQSRGLSYYRRGAVAIIAHSDTYVAAKVEGGRVYDVMLTHAAPKLTVSCTCPFFAGSGACKHIWAVVLEADAWGYLRAAADRRTVLIEDEFEEPLDDAWDEEPAEEGDAPFGEEWTGPAASGWRLDAGRTLRPARPAPLEIQPRWLRLLNQVYRTMDGAGRVTDSARFLDTKFVYVFDREVTLQKGAAYIDVCARKRRADGEWGRPKAVRIGGHEISRLPDPQDRRIMALLAGPTWGADPPYMQPPVVELRHVLSEDLLETVLPLLAATRRFFLRQAAHADLLPLALDEGPAWEFCLKVEAAPDSGEYAVRGVLRRGNENRPLAHAQVVLPGGWVLWDGAVARMNDFGSFPWIALLRREGEIRVPASHAEEMTTRLVSAPLVPRLELPPEFSWTETQGRASPIARLRAVQPGGVSDGTVSVELAFDYEGQTALARVKTRGLYRSEERRLILRDAVAEQAARARLFQLGCQAANSAADPLGLDLALPAKRVPAVVSALLAENWRVEADGRPYRRAGLFQVGITSGVDWFELRGSVEFDGIGVDLPELLSALRQGRGTILLGDGSTGVLPETWLTRYGALVEMGAREGDCVRFTRSQVFLLDALLAAQPEAQWDAEFDRIRNELRSFEAVKPAMESPEFHGVLRTYQREGVGWMRFLRRFGLGGCLADDMGLGKTVQVLALLEGLRGEAAAERDARGPEAGTALIVAPRSLIFNWKAEAQRFAPRLRCVDHTGVDRVKDEAFLRGHDVVFTTYGTLRRDAAFLREVPFEYVILDEAQAIKNPNTASAKAARLLRARHRLALSGTPVENRLGDLWSLFEFLNPGMLGASSVLRLATGDGEGLSDEMRGLLARVLRPFILRRTKAQVASDLPDRFEETLRCQLKPTQRRLYDELRDHYRRSLLTKIGRDGLGRSKILVLEALLRLRQAACHPGLIDPARAGQTSAKLDCLLPQVREVIDEGHKVLVFSQFTSLLAIVRNRLDAEHTVYEYLDGKTQDRAERVQRFQNDPDCRLFLISLKAGGLGLNLTAAEYVYLLDPWWNPAVEAQAIDRTHRIGQSRKVFAYRIIAENTVEERVLELQGRKRDLADAIITADNSLIRNLEREDLERLLS